MSRVSIVTLLMLQLVSRVARSEDARAPENEPAQIENPCVASSTTGCNRSALSAFVDAFAKAKSKEQVLRITYIGDSTTADDQIPQMLRTSFGELLGDGGPGFVAAVPAHPYCQHRAVSRVAGRLSMQGVISSAAPDHMMGLAGSVVSGAGELRVSVKSGQVKRLELYALAQPRGGEISVSADRKPLTKISTAGDTKASMFETVSLSTPAASFSLRSAGNTRWFGVALENDDGVVVDNLGLVNATAKILLRNKQQHWQEQLAHRAPDLVVIMLGTNEAEWLPGKGPAMDEHEQLFGELVASVRKSNPKRSCLVIPPFDQLDWRKPGLPPRSSVPAMVAVQKKVAAQHGCAFWNGYEWMGGAGSSRRWAKLGLVTRDYQHRSERGSQKIAAAIFRGLVAIATQTASN